MLLRVTRVTSGVGDLAVVEEPAVVAVCLSAMLGGAVLSIMWSTERLKG